MMDTSTFRSQERATKRRQDPVSCKLCRLKKLKCNRTSPCSNCVARSQPCEYEHNQATTAARIRHDAEPTNAAILSRLQRLEDMIMRMSQSMPPSPDVTSPARSEVAISSNPPSAPNPVEKARDIEAEHLSNVATSEPSSFPNMSDVFVFDTLPLDLILKRDTSSFEDRSLTKRQRRIVMPAYGDARIMFDTYSKHICHFHHVVHLPTLQKTIENFYLKLSHQEPVNTDEGALLLSVFATVLSYAQWTEFGTVKMPNEGRDSVLLLFFRWTFDLLDHSRRVLPASLEAVQAAIITIFLDYNLEGFTSRTRSMHAQGLYAAKELGMHRIDSPAAIRRREGTQSIDDMIQVEMKRRIWWHLVATDWMISLAGSGQEGTYVAIPQQMRVRLPRNINDDVLDRGNTTEDFPLTTPTAMAYPLQRVRLAEISRSIIDALRLGITDTNEHDLGQIMLFDQRIQHFLEDLPVFLKLDNESIAKSHYILEAYPHFAMQRYIVNVGAHSMRCKLHQQSLFRRNETEKHAISAQICLDSAMTVIEFSKKIRNDPTHHIPNRVKLTGLLHHMFVATGVIVMDVCFNKDARNDHSRSEELKYSLQILEESKEQSVSCQRFLDTLMEALKKHHVRINDEPPTTAPQAGQVLQPSSHPPGQLWQPSGLQPPSIATVGGLTPTESVFDNSLATGYWPWLTLQQGDNTKMPDWDQLFSELDTFIV